MSKPLSYKYTGTKGHIAEVAETLPKKGKSLLDNGWEDISRPEQAASGHYTYRERETGLRIRFDEAKPDKGGFSGRDHYHILNPDAHNTGDMYPDRAGNPVKKNSKASHIFSKGDY